MVLLNNTVESHKRSISKLWDEIRAIQAECSCPEMVNTTHAIRCGDTTHPVSECKFCGRTYIGSNRTTEVGPTPSDPTNPPNDKIAA